MKIVEEKTTLVQTSELRTNLEEVLRQVGKSRVVLEKRHKPVAVLVGLDDFRNMEEASEQLSDLLLAFEARGREKRKGGKRLTLAEVRRKLGLD